jgi:acyl-homoserine lactone acylase PvdQ
MVAALNLSLLALGSPAAGAATAPVTTGCLQKAGPVGDPFTDCSGGQVFNIVPPGQNGTYNLADFGKAQLVPPQYPPHTRDQQPLYADLVKVAPNLQAADISAYYKDASFLTDLSQAERVETFPAPHDGTVIIRDKQFGVPHIFGKTRADTEFGSGFASAEDRLFEMDVLRHVGRAQLTSFVGPSPSNIAMDCSVAASAGYSEAELQQQVDNFASLHSDLITIAGHTTTEGQQIVDDATGYVAGVNEYINRALTTDPTKLPAEYPLLQIPLLPWKPTDIVATATLVQAIFATGGGNEVASALLYQSLVSRYPEVQGNGQTQGANMWKDLRSQNDPEAQVSIKTPFSYEQVPPASSLDPKSLAMPTAPPTNNHCNPPPNATPGQFSVAGVTVDLTPLLAALSRGLPHASNELIVDAAHSASGHPIAVFGPQTGYFVPQLLHEVDLHGPGLQARGVSFAGTEVFVELGRGVDYAWSATSAGADIVDQRVERLCNPLPGPVDPNSQWYLYDDGKGGGPRCIQMLERTDTQVGKPSPGSPYPPTVLTIQVERTVHGPVVGRTSAIDPNTGQAVPVAVSEQRATFGDELGASPAFLEWNDPDIIHSATDFQRAAGKETGTFNWTYVDSHDVGYYMAGKLPVRNPHVNPNFPTWGTGQWEWQGFVPTDLSAADVHPRASTIPAQGGIVNGTLVNGFFTNWNNKPAPGFSAADSNFAYGPVYRVQPLSDRVKAVLSKGPARPVDIINAMEDAGTVDLDGSQLVGPLSSALHGVVLTAKQQQVLQTLQQWTADPFWGTGVPGAHRRDRSASGSYEQGNAVAIMDQLYPRLAHAVFDPTLNSGQFNQLAGLNPLNNPPGPTGSAYDGGWEGYLQRALRQAVNPAIPNGYSQNYCGQGSLGACQSALQAALQGAIDSLTATYGTSDPNAWTCSRSNTGAQCNPAQDDIQHNAVGVGTVPAMPWVNRPTFQQVVQYPGHRAPSGSGCHEGDGDGNLQGRGPGQAHFHFDVDQCEDGVQPTVAHQDPNTGTNFQSTQIQSVTFDDAKNSVVIAGLGVDNGQPVAFMAAAVDNGTLPLDLYSITLSDGYSRTGTPLTGTIQLH